MNKHLIILGFTLFIAGCASPTTEVRQLPTFTVIASSTSSAAEVTSTYLPTDTSTSPPTSEVTPTFLLTEVPTPSPADAPTHPHVNPLISISDIPRLDIPSVEKPIVSVAGQVAIIINKVLFVEQSAGSNDFQEIDRKVRDAYWSDDGGELYYYREVASYEQPEVYKWSADKNTPELVHGIDLSQPITDVLTKTYQIAPDRILVQWHCGSPCERLSVQDEQGHQIWSLPWATAGLFAFSPDQTYLINTGRVDIDITYATVDRIDLRTGDIQEIWQTPHKQGEFFSLFWQPSFSPDGKFISFNYGDPPYEPGTLHIIDTLGQDHWQLDGDSFLVDWQPNSDGLIALQQSEDHQSQLLYLTLNAPISHTITMLTSVEFVEGKWNPDSHQLAYSIFDKASGVSELYLWQLDSLRDILIFTSSNSEVICDLTWLPNGQELYFTLGETGWGTHSCGLCSSVWKYELNSGKVTLIASVPP
jgi:hypothetical protein